MTTNAKRLISALTELSKVWLQQIEVDPTDPYDEGYSTAKHECYGSLISVIREHGPELMKMLDRHGAGDGEDSRAALGLLSRMRFACGDNGLRMQDELEEYLRELARDAARYRWLRMNPNGTRFRVPCPDSIPECKVGHRGPCLMGETLDAAIDAAMHAPGGAGGGE